MRRAMQRARALCIRLLCFVYLMLFLHAGSGNYINKWHTYHRSCTCNAGAW